MDESASSTITVLLVDDQPLFRSGMRMLIDSQSDMKVVAEAENGLEGVAVAESVKPDVILMDLRMPIIDGVAATRRILNSGPGDHVPKIIALTTFNKDQAVVDAVQAGASGYLLKSAEPEFLIAAIRTVHSGYSVIAPSSVSALFRRQEIPSAPFVQNQTLLEKLSARELEVFHMAVTGAPNIDIATTLFISEATVKTHMRSLLVKLGLRTRIQLIAFAYEHHLFKNS